MVILQCPRPAAFKCVFIQDRVDVGKKYNLIDHTEFLIMWTKCLPILSCNYSESNLCKLANVPLKQFGTNLYLQCGSK